MMMKGYSMKQFIDDHYPFIVTITFVIILITSLLISTYLHDRKYMACIEAKMQYVSGNCVIGRVETK
jgi:hypothetical protein